MHARLRRSELDRKGGDVDVEVLLHGAEKLCSVYDLPGARERIASLRAKYRNGKDTAAYYEAKVAQQAEQLASLSKNWMEDDETGEDGNEREDDGFGAAEIITEEDLRREEEEAREMEAKKRELQARLKTMEKDLGGLMNM